jgi:uncharacterized protein (TIGR02118 family)
MKMLSLIGRRADYSADGFLRYYEDLHAPLAIRTIGFARYVRNHVKARSPALPAFDVLPEFEFTDFSRVAAVLATPAGAAVRADEANFMGSVRHVAQSDEIVVADAAAGFDRITIFFRRTGSAAPDPVALRDWAKSFAADAMRTTIDMITHLPANPFPADMLVSFWSVDDPSSGAPKGYERIGEAALQVHETPSIELRATASR